MSNNDDDIRNDSNDSFSFWQMFLFFQISPLTQMKKLEYSFLIINCIICISIFALYVLIRDDNSFKNQTLIRVLDNDSEISSDNVDLNLKTEILSSLIPESFNGTWQSDKLINNFSHMNGTVQIMFRTFKRFKGKDGFFFNYDIYFLDGNTNNHSFFISNSYPLKYEDEFPLVYYKASNQSESDEDNVTVVIENKLLSSFHELRQLKFLSNKIIRSNLTLEYNKKNKTEIKGIAEFDEGKFTFTVQKNTEFFYGDMFSLCLCLIFLGLYQYYVFSTLNRKFEIDDTETLKYSPYLFMMNCIFNGGIGFECFLATLIDERLFNYFVIPTLLYFCSFCLLEPRIIFEVMKAQINRQFNDNYIRMLVIRKRLIYFFICFYVILIFFTFYSYDIFFWKSTCYILISVTFVPQIYFHFKTFPKKMISSTLIGIVCLNKIVLVYKFRYKENFLYFEQDLCFCLLTSGILLFQLLVLVFLRYFGRGKFFRRFYDINVYNYYYTSKEIERKKIVLAGKICTICLSSFTKDGSSILTQGPNEANKNGENLNLSDIGNKKNKEKVPLGDKKEEKKRSILNCCNKLTKRKNDVLLMITPCNHVFHSDCLERWMKVKNTCPDCRAELPNIE